MQKRPKTNKTVKKEDVIGSETIFEKMRSRTPWVFGKSLKKPKINFPSVKLPRIETPISGRMVAIIAIFIGLFLLQTGIIYLIYVNPPALGVDPKTKKPLILYPSIQDSFIIEGVVASILIFLCSIGFIFLYQASKYVYNRKIAVRLLAIGIILVLVTYTVLQAMITIKLGRKLFNV
ncbi:MAG: hypothetical protein ACTSRH_17480 [Promethearchaeota archaeon]